MKSKCAGCQTTQTVGVYTKMCLDCLDQMVKDLEDEEE